MGGDGPRTTDSRWPGGATPATCGNPIAPPILAELLCLHHVPLSFMLAGGAPRYWKRDGRGGAGAGFHSRSPLTQLCMDLDDTILLSCCVDLGTVYHVATMDVTGSTSTTPAVSSRGSELMDQRASVFPHHLVELDCGVRQQVRTRRRTHTWRRMDTRAA